ncbi:MAG: S8 family serine peptidase [Chloroflexota bacterium]
MQQKRTFLLFLALCLAVAALVLAAPLLAAGGAEDSENSPIYLKSRTVQPASDAGAAQAEDGASVDAYGLIQLETVPDEAQRAQLEAAGVELLGYIPHNSWLARFPADNGRVRALTFVRWMGPLLPQDKVDPAIYGGNFGSWAVNNDETVNLWVTPFAGVTLEEAERLIAAHEGAITRQETEYHRLHITLPPEQLAALASEDKIQWITQAPPPRQSLNDGSREAIAADGVHDSPYFLSGAGVQAGMWDAAVADNSHDDFGGRLIAGEEYPSGASDINHATHVAGILGGDGSLSEANGGDAGQWRGIAPGLQIYSFHWGFGTMDHDTAINSYGIDLSQNSWAIGGCADAGEYDSWSNDYDAIVTGIYGRRIPVIFAAGNQRQQCDDPYGTIHRGPQSAKNVVTVGGIHSVDSTMMDRSSWGPVLDGRLKPDVVAAGQSEPSRGIYSTISQDRYGSYGGTSMAAPAVSGSMALVLEQYHNACTASGDSAGNPLPSTTRALILHGADDLDDPGLDYLNAGPDYSSGYGRVNSQRTVKLVPHHVEGDIVQGETNSYALTVNEGDENLKVTLVWDDVPAEPNAARALINNLDLEVVAPDGETVYGPWLLDPANPQQPAQRHSWTKGDEGARDDLNVVEQVVVDAPEAGTWTVRVRGATVPEGPQSYSLVGEQLVESSCEAEPIPTAITLDKTEANHATRDAVRNSVLLALFGLLALGTGGTVITRLAPARV